MKKGTICVFLSLALLGGAFAAVTMSTGPISLGGTIYVDDDNTSGVEDGSMASPYNTIQEGVDAAAAGDTVFVFNGTYLENVLITKSINLTGEAPTATIINGSGGMIAVEVSANDVNIQGFTIKKSEYGVYLGYSDNCLLTENIMTENSEVGLYLRNSSNCLLTENMVTKNGEGIFLSGSSNNSITRNLIVENTFRGITPQASSNNNLIEANNISANEAAIEIYQSRQNLVRENYIQQNMIGILLANCSQTLIYHNSIIDNPSLPAYSIASPDNQWDDGYPSGGNYWSDYTGVDSYSGPLQDIPGSDGIGDTPYIISSKSQPNDPKDNYPLMGPWGSAPSLYDEAEEKIDEIKDYINDLPDEAFEKNPDQKKNTLSNKLDAVLNMIAEGDYEGAINKLENDIRRKMDGEPSPKDWIIDPEAQQDLMAMIDELIAWLEGL